MKKYILITIAAIILLLIGGGLYVFWKSRSIENQPNKNSEISPHQEPGGAVQEETIKDAGDFVVKYDSPEDPRYSNLQKILEDSKLFNETAEDLNKNFALPFDVPIRFTQCGEVNAYYDPEEKQIKMCYELVEGIAQDFAQLSLLPDELDKATLDTVFFIFYHELGHALIDIYKLPAVGKEEDAVDQLATLILTKGGESGEKVALDGGFWFAIRGAKTTKLKQLAFWDEHGLDSQRFYNIVCLVYGKNPEQHSDLITQGFLPEERANRCEDEYQKIKDSWENLLAPYSK